MFFLLSTADFFHNQPFGKIISGMPSVCRTWQKIMQNYPVGKMF